MLQGRDREACSLTGVANRDGGLHKSIHLHDCFDDDNRVDKHVYVVGLEGRSHRRVIIVQDHWVARRCVNVQIDGGTCTEPIS